MNVKKTLQNRIRGWLPQEPNVPKTPTRTGFPMKMKTDNRKQVSPGFKVRRWLHGVSALLRQRSLGTKIKILAFGILIFTVLSMLFLVDGNLVSGEWGFFWGRTALYGFILVMIAGYLYDFFKKKEYRNTFKIIKSPLGLLGTAFCAVAVTTWVYGSFLAYYHDWSDLQSFTTPFYLGLVAFFAFVLGLKSFLMASKRRGM